MIKEKISSQEIIDLVASKASVSKRAAEEFLKVMIASIEEALMAGEVVKIKSFGTFKLLWNEPRKSVNIQTGEEIKINGYYKVGFVPDVVMKGKINEPFAHLEPVELDVEIKTTELIDEVESVSDPLRIFNEQASEIKNLISEIQALSPTAKNSAIKKTNEKETNTEEEVKIKKLPIDAKLIELNIEDDSKLIEESQSAKIRTIPSSLQSTTEHIIENKEVPKIEIDSLSVSELPTTPYLDNIQTPKKRKLWVWIVVIGVLIIGTGTGSCIFYPPAREFSKVTIANCQYTASKIAENLSFSELINTVSKWFSPAQKPVPKAETIIIPKVLNDIDSITAKQPVDSLQILFETPRVYKDFIASERITPGNRLTIISKRYYGSKDFWVYIYEANKERISNPDNIAIGTFIRIPKLDQRLIDVSNPRCLEKAKELHDIYIN